MTINKADKTQIRFRLKEKKNNKVEGTSNMMKGIISGTNKREKREGAAGGQRE